MTHDWKSRSDWVVVLAGVSAALHVGKLAPSLPLLQRELGMTLLQAGFLLSLVQVAGMALGLVAGLAANSIGLRRCVLGGLLVLAFASVAGGVSTGVGTLLGWRAVEGVGFLLVCMPAPALLRRLVPPAHQAQVLGLWGAYMPLGTALALLCGPWVVQWVGWRSWWWILGAISLLLFAWVWRVVPHDPDGWHWPGHYSQQQRAESLPMPGWTRRLQVTLTSRGPWLVALVFAVYSGQWLAVIGFLPYVLADRAVAGAALSLPLALVAGVNIVGNIAAGRALARGVAPQHLLFVGFCAMALGAAVAFAELNEAQTAGLGLGWRFAGVLVFSMFGGLIPATLFSLAVLVAPDESSVSTTVGWMQQLSAFGQFVGPPLVAWVAAGAGSWRWTWCVTGAACLVGLLLARLLGRGVRP